MDYLRKIYKADLEDTIVGFINAEATKTRGRPGHCKKHGPIPKGVGLCSILPAWNSGQVNFALPYRRQFFMGSS